MITAIDTSVLISIDQEEAGAARWMDLLQESRRQGALVICDVVAAEFYASVLNESEGLEILRMLGIEKTAMSHPAYFHAGQIFRKYRDQGGPREHLIPDFLVAAHGLVECDRLLSPDRGYLRRYFPDLTVVH